MADDIDSLGDAGAPTDFLQPAITDLPVRPIDFTVEAWPSRWIITEP